MVLAEVDQPPLTEMTDEQRGILAEWTAKYDSKYDVVGAFSHSTAGIGDGATAPAPEAPAGGPRQPAQWATAPSAGAPLAAAQQPRAQSPEDPAMGLVVGADEFVPSAEFQGVRSGYHLRGIIIMIRTPELTGNCLCFRCRYLRQE
eukprot:COSAG01_NODE_4599_length_4887_cov_3.402047_7_plen_146_part_00